MLIAEAQDAGPVLHARPASGGRRLLPLRPLLLRQVGRAGAQLRLRQRSGERRRRRAAKRCEGLRDKHYHQPADELSPTWDFTGMAQDAELLHGLGRDLANSRDWPNWSEDSEFRAARDQSAAERDASAPPEERRTRLSASLEASQVSPTRPDVTGSSAAVLALAFAAIVWFANRKQPELAPRTARTGTPLTQGAAVGRLPDRRPDVRRPAQCAPHRRPGDTRLPRQGADRQAAVRPRSGASDRMDRRRRPDGCKSPPGRTTAASSPSTLPPRRRPATAYR